MSTLQMHLRGVLFHWHHWCRLLLQHHQVFWRLVSKRTTGNRHGSHHYVCQHGFLAARSHVAIDRLRSVRKELDVHGRKERNSNRNISLFFNV